jgi:hypothetical protein
VPKRRRHAPEHQSPTAPVERSAVDPDVARFASLLRDDERRKRAEARARHQQAADAKRLADAVAEHQAAAAALKQAKAAGRGVAEAEGRWRAAAARRLELESGERPSWAPGEESPPEESPPEDSVGEVRLEPQEE